MGFSLFTGLSRTLLSLQEQTPYLCPATSPSFLPSTTDLLSVCLLDISSKWTDICPFVFAFFQHHVSVMCSGFTHMAAWVRYFLIFSDVLMAEWYSVVWVEPYLVLVVMTDDLPQLCQALCWELYGVCA